MFGAPGVGWWQLGGSCLRGALNFIVCSCLCGFLFVNLFISLFCALGLLGLLGCLPSGTGCRSSAAANGWQMALLGKWLRLASLWQMAPLGSSCAWAIGAFHVQTRLVCYTAVGTAASDGAICFCAAGGGIPCAAAACWCCGRLRCVPGVLWST